MNNYRVEPPKGMDALHSSMLAKAFFSNQNMDIIQKMLILEVYKKINVRIPYQEPQRLVIAMNYVYSIYAKELPVQIKEQVRELNKYVLQWIVPDVIASAEQYLAYIRDSTQGPRLLEPPLNVTRRGGTRITELPGDRQLPDSIHCCPYDEDPDYPERKPVTYS